MGDGNMALWGSSLKHGAIGTKITLGDPIPIETLQRKVRDIERVSTLKGEEGLASGDTRLQKEGA